MKLRLVSFLVLLVCSWSALAISPDRLMSRIDRKARKIQKCKCLSKVQEHQGTKVKYYFTKRKNLVRIIEQRTINGATVIRQFLIHKKTGDLMSVTDGVTIFYYHLGDYFAVLSSDHFSEQKAKQLAEALQAQAQHYIQEIK